MKTCPSCGYKNPGPGAACGICGKDLSGLTQDAPPAVAGGKAGWSDWGLIILGLASLTIGFYLALRETPAPRPRSEPAAEKGFSNGGIVLTLEKMSALVLPGPREREAVEDSFASEDWKVRQAGVRAAGAWLRAGAPGAGRLKAKLGAALRDSAPAVKKEAGMEAGLLLGLGRLGSAELPRLEEEARAFMDDGDDGVKGAGYFLAAMGGLTGLKGRLLEASASEPLALTRLNAACALARFGSAEAAASVFRAAADPDPAVRMDAALCLSYTADPAAVPLLKKLAALDQDPGVAGNARFSLKLREQLAIINIGPG